MGRWVALAAALFAATPAVAQDVIYSDIAPSEVVRVLRAEGYSARITTSSAGNPVVWSRLEDTVFGVFFYNCNKAEEQRCAEIQFYAGFRVKGLFPTVLINEWNKTKRFGRAYIDGNGNAALEMDLDATGTTDLQLRDALELWARLVPAFAAFLDESMKTS